MFNNRNKNKAFFKIFCLHFFLFSIKHHLQPENYNVSLYKILGLYLKLPVDFCMSHRSAGWCRRRMSMGAGMEQNPLRRESGCVKIFTQ